MRFVGQPPRKWKGVFFVLEKIFSISELLFSTHFFKLKKKWAGDATRRLLRALAKKKKRWEKRRYLDFRKLLSASSSRASQSPAPPFWNRVWDTCFSLRKNISPFFCAKKRTFRQRWKIQNSQRGITINIQCSNWFAWINQLLTRQK